MSTLFIDTRLNDFGLPIVANYDNDYYLKLHEKLDKYYKHIETIENLPIKTVKSTLSNIENIYHSLQYYNNALIYEAKECIRNIIVNYIDESYIVSEIDKSYAFRGIAPFKLQQKKFGYDVFYNDDYNKMNSKELNFFKARISIEDIEIKDMLHIPFDKRGLISTQRFSMSGVPCIYFSTTSFGCWSELGMPENELFNVSSYKIPTDLTVLNLCISQYTINGSTGGGYVEEYDLPHLCNLIEIYPLICATSIRILDNNRNFKSEYIVSQLLMQVVNELGIDAVAYLSKKTKDYYAYPQMVNIAIPVKNQKSPFDINKLNIYCKDANKIMLTQPIKFSEFLKIKSLSSIDQAPPYLSYINEIYHDTDENNKILIAGCINKYTKTKFSEFDEYLVNQTHSEFRC